MTTFRGIYDNFSRYSCDLGDKIDDKIGDKFQHQFGSHQIRHEGRTKFVTEVAPNSSRRSHQLVTKVAPTRHEGRAKFVAKFGARKFLKIRPFNTSSALHVVVFEKIRCPRRVVMMLSRRCHDVVTTLTCHDVTGDERQQNFSHPINSKFLASPNLSRKPRFHHGFTPHHWHKQLDSLFHDALHGFSLRADCLTAASDEV